MIRLIPASVCLFLGAFFLAIPVMTRRGILFAVPIPAEFRTGPLARGAISEYRALVGLAALLCMALILFLPAEALEATAISGPLVVIAAAIAGFVREYRRIRPFATQPAGVREAELSAAPDRLPGYFWLAAGPPAIFAALAFYLHANWNRIPARFPTHWDASGQPNGFHERTFRGVYGPLVFGAEICLFLLGMALAGWFGSRRSRMRNITVSLLIATDYTVAFVFAGVAIMPLGHVNIWLLVLLPMAFLAIMLIVATRKVSHTRPAPEPTPNECWKGGVVYYNPADPALFVEKRTGLGYTANFGNRWSWVLMAGTLALLASAFVLF